MRSVQRTCCSAGVDINTCDDQGLTIFLKALNAGQFGIAEIQLSYGADINARNKERKLYTDIYLTQLSQLSTYSKHRHFSLAKGLQCNSDLCNGWIFI